MLKSQGFGHKAPNCRKKVQKCVVCGKVHSHKNCLNSKKRNPNCANCMRPHLANYRGCPAYKDQAFRQHVVQNQVSYASIIKESSPTTSQKHIQFHHRSKCLPGNKRGNSSRSIKLLCQSLPSKYTTYRTRYRFDKTEDDLFHNTLKDSLTSIDTDIAAQDELEELAVTFRDKLVRQSTHPPLQCTAATTPNHILVKPS